MSLNWNVEEIENHEEVCFIRREPLPSEGNVETGEDGKARYMNPVTEVLIFATISTKIGMITKDNAGEFYARLSLVERMDGPFLKDGEGNDRRITPEDVQAHIGLVCNVINENRPGFYKSIGNDLDRYKASYERATRKSEEVTA